MIVNYSNDGRQIADYLKKLLNDKVIARSAGGKPRTIFSVNPFVFIFDLFSMQSAAFLRSFAYEKFTGSKATYCIFLSENYNDDYLNYAVRVTRQKHLVLFGGECIVDRITTQTGIQLERMADKIKGYCPFERKNGVAFPIYR